MCGSRGLIVDPIIPLMACGCPPRAKAAGRGQVPQDCLEGKDVQAKAGLG